VPYLTQSAGAMDIKSITGNMKKITIELTEEQHTQMMNHLQRETAVNMDNETFSPWLQQLKCVEGGILGLKLK
jgi:hypothetical protein